MSLCTVFLTYSLVKGHGHHLSRGLLLLMQCIHEAYYCRICLNRNTSSFSHSLRICISNKPLCSSSNT